MGEESKKSGSEMGIKHWMLDAQGEPVMTESLDEWVRWLETADRELARTELPDGGFVSTVFLGVDHAFDGGPPVLWETMVFPDCDICERYTSRLEAVAGHARFLREHMVKLLTGMHGRRAELRESEERQRDARRARLGSDDEPGDAPDLN